MPASLSAPSWRWRRGDGPASARHSFRSSGLARRLAAHPRLARPPARRPDPAGDRRGCADRRRSRAGRGRGRGRDPAVDDPYHHRVRPPRPSARPVRSASMRPTRRRRSSARSACSAARSESSSRPSSSPSSNLDVHGRGPSFAFLATVVAGQFAVANLVKWLVDRARPAIDQLTGFAGSSFPSGHATAAAATYAAFALLLGRNRSDATKAVLAGDCGGRSRSRSARRGCSSACTGSPTCSADCSSDGRGSRSVRSCSAGVGCTSGPRSRRPSRSPSRCRRRRSDLAGGARHQTGRALTTVVADVIAGGRRGGPRGDPARGPAAALRR